MSRLLLLDTASLYFRAFFGVPDSLRSPQGEPVNAVRGLLDMIATLVHDHEPTRLVACWDDEWRPAFRVAAIGSYKEHRVAEGGFGARPDGGDVEERPEALTPQIAVIAEVLAALGIPRVGHPGFEADDIIGTLVTREVEAGSGRTTAERTAVDVVTGDRDLFQLVDDDAAVRILYPARGIKNVEVVDQARLAEKYGVPTGQAYAEMATLRGDPSDGLPGVRGIGEKTAATLLDRFGGLAGILRARDDESERGLTATQRTRLVEAADYLDAAPTVVQVARDVPVGEITDALPTAPADPAALDALVERWGVGTSVKRVLDAFASAR